MFDKLMKGLEITCILRNNSLSFLSGEILCFRVKKKSSPTYNFHGIKMKVITFIPLIIYMKKLLDSDWLTAVQFKCNTSAKSVTPVQKV